MRRARYAAIAACAFAALGAAAQDAAPARDPARSPVCEPRRSEDRVEGMTERGDIRLASGRLAKLAGITRPEEPAAVETAATWLASFRGSPVEMAALASEPDRWGRLPVMIRVTSDAGPIDLNRGLVAAGLAIVDAGEADRLCQPELLAAEARARESCGGATAISRSRRPRSRCLQPRRAIRPRRRPDPLRGGAGPAHLSQLRSRLERRFHDHNSATNLADHA